MATTLRPAKKNDFSAVFRFISSLSYLHRHLDWRDTLEFLGRPPFWLLEEDQKITAALCCTPEPEEVAWVRLFAVSVHASIDRAWQKLFTQSMDDLRSRSVQSAVVTLALREWYEDLLKRNGFDHHQDIVVFLYDQEPPPPPRIDPAFHLREVHQNDLDAVRVIDNLAFEPIWRLSLDDLRHAVKKSSYATLIEHDGKVIAYQMSSTNGMYAHLDRLAVHPDLQGQRLGYALVQNLLDYYINRLNLWGVTLNTQHNNSASIALYQKIGFTQTGERFPVYLFNQP